MFMMVHCSRILLVFLAVCVGFGVAAQNTPEYIGDGTLDLTTHEATMRTFTEAMENYLRGDDGAITLAAACLWLEDLDEERRATDGSLLAEQLFDLIDSSLFRLSDFTLTVRNEGTPNETAFASTTIRQDPDVELVVLRNSDGRWRISYDQTLRFVPEWHEQANHQAATPPSADVHPLYWSARATMRTFLFSMHPDRQAQRDRAISALDLSQVPDLVREERGETNANILKFILDRHSYVWLYGIPDTTEGPRYVHLEREEGRIIIARVEPPPAQDTEPAESTAAADETTEGEEVAAPTGPPAKWLFTPGTIASLETLQAAYQEQEVVEGVKTTSSLPLRIQLRNYVTGLAPWLSNEVFYVQVWQWLGLFIVVVIGWIFSRAIGAIIIFIVDRWIGSRKNDEIQQHETKFVRPIRIALMSWVWIIGLQLVNLPDTFYSYLMNIAEVVTVVALVWAGYRAIDVIGAYILARTKRTASTFDDLLVPIVTRTIKVIVVIVGGLVLADIYHLPVSNIVAGLGIGGLAVAFAAQQTISNFFGSITILIDQPFKIGDWIVIGDVDGSVESVGLRSTRVRTFYNSLITVPNATLMSENIDNYGKRRYRRIKHYVGVTYDTPPDLIETFCEGIRELIRNHPYTRKDYFHVYFNQFNAASLDIMIYCFVECPDWGTELRERERLFLDVIRLANELGVEFAFPTQTLHVHNEEISAKEHSPNDRLRAFLEGRKHARDVVVRSFGDPTRKPPPVTFDNADGIERDILEAGFDDDGDNGH